MDAINRRILELLDRDARVPLKTIAADVGLARSSVSERIARLEASGVIRGYRVELAPGAAPTSVEAYLLMKLARTPDPGLVEAVCEQAAVLSCCSVGGETDLIVHVRVADTAALNTLRDRFAADPRVKSLTTHIILKHDR
jgi:DNA-binding Lrp family transcriptional regulator